MAKDPAFLFYPGDYLSGTMHLDFECKGAYMDLLMLQFQKDHMTIHMIKHMLGHRFEHIWPLITDKFVVKDGKYWNERLRIEKEKRAKFCKSRKKNREGNKDMNKHMSSHMENENENINENDLMGVTGGSQEGMCWDIEKYLLGKQKDLEAICLTTKKSLEELKSILTNYHLWNIQNEIYPKKPLPLIAGFTRWALKDKNFNKNGSHTKQIEGTGRSLRRDKL